MPGDILHLTPNPDAPIANVPIAYGLDEVIAARTSLSDVDGTHGRLVLGGFELPELTQRFGVEGTAGLLIDGDSRPHLTRPNWRARLGRARLMAFGDIDRVIAATRGLDIAEGLRASLAALRDSDDDGDAKLIGASAVYAAALIRRSDGLPPVAPDPSLSHAEDYLRMIHGKLPSLIEAKAMDSYLVTIADHGLNASTFAARVVASTASDRVSGAVAALGALKGPLHGGAPGPVLDMLDAIGTPEHAATWVNAALLGGDRLMGFGHRIYRVRDPRADVLKAAVRSLGSIARISLAEAVEEAARHALAQSKPGRALETNVEFYTAVLLEALGIPRTAFTATFAVGRIVGWCAHMAEQRQTGRLIRPQSVYVGRAVA
jgi:citrate synthase